MRKGGYMQWEGGVRSLQIGEAVPLHVGGRGGLSLEGNEHYGRLGDAVTITLYGPARPPGWLGKLSLEERFEFLGKGGFNLPPLSFTAGMPERLLSEHGLAWHQRSEEHTSELQSLMRISYAVFCLKKKTTQYYKKNTMKAQNSS